MILKYADTFIQALSTTYDLGDYVKTFGFMSLVMAVEHCIRLSIPRLKIIVSRQKEA